MPTNPKVAVYGTIFAILVVVLLVIPATGAFHVPRLGLDASASTRGRVVSIADDHLEDSPRGPVRSQTIIVQTATGNATIKRSFATGDAGTIAVQPGDRVLLGEDQAPDGVTYYIADYVRDVPLWLLAGAFVLMVVFVGQVSGAFSLVGMVTSLLIIIRFVIPAILSGANPLLIAILGSLLIMSTTIYLAHGVNLKATVALLGTAGSLLLTGLLAVASVHIFKLTGLANEDSSTLAIMSVGRINASGLLLASIIIGGLGVLADITIGQASAVFELAQVMPQADATRLFHSGMNVGRDHVAAIVNTLVLAYAGASLPLLIILSTQTEPLSNLLSREFMATEIVRTLVASIGILAAVPLTTLLAAGFASGSLGWLHGESEAPAAPPPPRRTLPAEGIDLRRPPDRL